MAEKISSVPALERGLQLLEKIAAHPDGVAAAELGSLGLPTASLYRSLNVLQTMGYITGDGKDGYRLSRKLLKMAYQATAGSLVERALPVMRDLAADCRETVLLGTLYGSEGVVLEEIASSYPVKVTVAVGHHFPLHSAAPGKAMLAFLPPERRRELLGELKFTRFNERTITDKDLFLKELEVARDRGFAIDYGEEIAEIRCVAAPVLDYRGQVAAALWIGGPASRMPDTSLAALGSLVKDAAARIAIG